MPYVVYILSVTLQCSKGRHGHVNYRDSKLTRILQPCLGGNARTAIICTLSPALSHIEQSRNSLLFASCAKEVTTNAQVNVVMSDKALVKHLQKELARLESELRTPGPTFNCDHTTLLRKKDLQIEKVMFYFSSSCLNAFLLFNIFIGKKLGGNLNSSVEGEMIVSTAIGPKLNSLMLHVFILTLDAKVACLLIG